MSDTPNPTLAVVSFIGLTTIYAPIKYFLEAHRHRDGGIPKIIILSIYVLCLTIIQFVLNLFLTNAMCGGYQWGTSLIVTLIPWIVIFGLINILLVVFPGWLGPFSNTFGYMIALIAGLNKLIYKIFKSKDKASGNILPTLEEIYGNKSLLINEITTQNFDEFWNRTSNSGLFSNDANIYKSQLFNMIRLKTIVSEYVWLILTGIFVTSVSYNYIVNSKCSFSEKEMKSKVDSYDSEIENDISTNEEPRIYTESD